MFWPSRRTDNGRTRTTEIYSWQKSRDYTRYPNDTKMYELKGDPDVEFTEVSKLIIRRWRYRISTLV